MAGQKTAQEGNATFESEILKKVETVKNDILKEAKESPRGVHFEESKYLYSLFDSDLRTTALVLQTLNRLDPDHPYIPKILKYLLVNRKDGHYATTQETAIYMLVMTEYIQSTHELDASYKADVTLNGKQVIDKKFSIGNIGDTETVKIPLTELLPKNQDNQISFSKNGIGKLYGDITLKYYLPTEQIQPRNEGILVTNSYYKLDDEKMEHPVNSAKVGETLKVKTTLVVPDQKYYVMLEDFLPAGLEGIDFSLETSKKNLKIKNSQSYLNETKSTEGLSDIFPESETLYWRGSWATNWYFSHSEIKDDRVMYFADNLPKGVYNIEYFVRASIKGTFHDLPALAQETYFPEVFGRSKGSIFTVE
jgi:uncharacterized protein YfaS (alpha-2-macroglobulin family)